jgi:hypothetical protein
MDLEIRHIAEFHANVDGVGDDRDVAAVAQAPCYPSCGSACRQTDGFVLCDQFGRGHSDVPLLLHKAMFAGLERRVVAKRLIEQFLHQSRAAVGAPDQAPGLQARQIPADTRSRRSQRSDQLLHGDGTFLQQQLQDLIVAVLLANRH